VSEWRFEARFDRLRVGEQRRRGLDHEEEVVREQRTSGPGCFALAGDVGEGMLVVIKV